MTNNKKQPVSIQVFQEVIDHLREHPTTREATTTTWLENAIKHMLAGKRHCPAVLHQLLGCRRRILNDNTEYRNMTAAEQKAQRNTLNTTLIEQKDKLYVARELALAEGNEEEYERYKALHLKAIRAIQDFHS